MQSTLILRIPNLLAQHWSREMPGVVRSDIDANLPHEHRMAAARLLAQPVSHQNRRSVAATVLEPFLEGIAGAQAGANSLELVGTRE